MRQLIRIKSVSSLYISGMVALSCGHCRCRLTNQNVHAAMLLPDVPAMRLNLFKIYHCFSLAIISNTHQSSTYNSWASEIVSSSRRNLLKPLVLRRRYVGELRQPLTTFCRHGLASFEFSQGWLARWAGGQSGRIAEAALWPS